jgi:hypothetical protein
MFQALIHQYCRTESDTCDSINGIVRYIQLFQCLVGLKSIAESYSPCDDENDDDVDNIGAVE